MNKKELCKRIVNTLSNLGDLQIDKSIKEFCDKVWTTPSVEVPKPSLNPKQRVRSWANLFSMNEGTPISNGEHNTMGKSQDLKSSSENCEEEDRLPAV